MVSKKVGKRPSTKLDKRKPSRDNSEHPHVVVKFNDQVQLPYEDGVEKRIEELKVGAWRRLEKEFPGISLRRLSVAVKPDAMRELTARAAELDPSYRPVNLASYFYVDAPPDTNLDALARALRAWPSVQTAYVDRPAPDPLVSPGDDPRSPNQGYLDPSPDGIDAEYAWGFTGGDGAGQRFIDLERGWTLDHEDLSAHGATLLHGVLLDTSRNHGTSVLGEICAVDNAIGCVGITPHVASVDVVSYNGSTRYDAILAAITNLTFGDVLLLEAQVTGENGILAPIEVFDAEFDAIRLATALGIVVVEAGGNGTNNGSPPPQNLDTYTNADGKLILFRDPLNEDFRDSGAIIVSAATSTAPHTRLSYGPHGRRIDCYAWAQNINTCASNAAGANNLYTTGFSGTSGASPIITGAALAVQGIAEASLGYRFSPRQLRAILSDPATNTPPAVTETTLIGVMPDLRGIIDDVLNVAPDVYIRDFVGDTGEPHNGSISSSPDIILRPDAVADPQASFGVGSGTENSNTQGSTAEIGQDNFIYVRVLNQGGSPASDVTATIFWSPPATLVTPDLWTPVGSVNIPNVPTGEQLTVSDALVWPAASIPGEGHYCFVGLIGTDSDPAPDPAEFLDWDNFRRFIRENNNVTWRNFNVEDNDPSPDPSTPRGFIALPFLAPGAPDKARPMQLEVIARLPRGARALLEVPLYFVELMREKSPFVKEDAKKGTALLPLNPCGKRLLGDILFPARSRSQLRLLVSIPEELRKNTYEIAVRQLFRRQEVGRITWRLAPGVREARAKNRRARKNG